MGRRADIDLTNQYFNELFVVGPSNIRKHNKPTWDCVCLCGKTCNYTTSELKSGRAKSCGHLRGKSRMLDLTGEIFSDLTVLYKVPNKGNAISSNGNLVGRTYWHCMCTCGKECDVQTSDLTSGNRKDCGHSHNAFMHEKRTKDISGNIYKHLEVLEMLPAIKRGNKWRSMCRVKCLLCGKIFDIQTDYIKSGDTTSCGCLKSKGEFEISQYLDEHNVRYKTQYTFKDLKTPKNWYCYFDFGIIDENNLLKFLIEFQGKQHFEPSKYVNAWNFGSYEREVTDPLKKEYCLLHNIPLYEIKYDANITEELDKIFAS